MASMIRLNKQLIIGMLVLGLLTPSAFSGHNPTNEDLSMTLEATPVDPETLVAEGKVPVKKSIPIYLQPFEFIFSSIVHALMFWKTGEELD